MSYQQERERCIVQLTKEGLPYHTIETLLRQATTIHRLAELACSSEAADRDRVPCPADKHHTNTKTRQGPCLCDFDGTHHKVPRIRVQDWRAEERATAALPDGWTLQTEGDPRGYTLRVIPPSYAERNQGRDRCNRDMIGIPARESLLRF